MKSLKTILELWMLCASTEERECFERLVKLIMEEIQRSNVSRIGLTMGLGTFMMLAAQTAADEAEKELTAETKKTVDEISQKIKDLLG